MYALLMAPDSINAKKPGVSPATPVVYQANWKSGAPPVLTPLTADDLTK